MKNWKHALAAALLFCSLITFRSFAQPPVLHAASLLRSAVAAAPATNLLLTVHIEYAYQIQQSSDLQNWTVTTNICFPDAACLVPNGGGHLNFRGCWTNAAVLITTNKP